ncbi:TlyA family RNA methyltransferase [Marinobacterium mangrovicola]|uniref:23S rRNA (Cytidine1920-2'-O)/16S rRNA (Cytidine1409-2'-O)-methyltransferase n=1 Tax=Marinobacterium mangrovicola TaxID=1476959 RepID=A0A4R1GJG4_9GAMM|nr:TlyA family RNA methyltransferase [Marinobacterium mangrovicola]TCK08158.1 23S rRNA (cytidine1920-2'-O)/16S rRNA (cytidine1409-2'-O)-methyltransferase [Marinobacterium mangrovicola]
MQRLDILLVERGLVSSRARAQRLIKEGRIKVNLNHWQVAQKPGLKLPFDTEIEIEEDESDRYVSRGALKLIPSLESFAPNLDDLSALDVGQSTGGFTDCLLQRGITRVVGIEVGHDQLAPNLRQDPRVTCIEGYNARNLGSDVLLHNQGEAFDLAVMDVSFISQTLILEGLAGLLKPGGLLFSLVKPQFELGREHIGKNGLVRDESLYPALRTKMEKLLSELGFTLLNYTDSPIRGGDGNREFMLVARKKDNR